jgi:hypothetical protein
MQRRSESFYYIDNALFTQEFKSLQNSLMVCETASLFRFVNNKNINSSKV